MVRPDPNALSSIRDYAGDLTPSQAWQWLANDADAVLVDVRTDAEWCYVGEPDLSAANKVLIRVSWQHFPEMRPAPDFVDSVRAQGLREHQTVLLLCRSGVRSLHAAKALTSAGFVRCYNIAEGFEGDKDSCSHRASVNGWKVRGLPWRQA